MCAVPCAQPSRHRALVAALALIMLLPISALAQPSVAGTWHVEGSGPPFPWELALRTDGTRLEGFVTSCASNRGAHPIFDGRIEADGITFKCRSGDGQRTLAFVGRPNGERIDFSWTIEVASGGVRDPRPDGMFHSSAPTRFTATRTVDGELTKAFDRAVPGIHIAGAFNVLAKDVRADGSIFVPRKTMRARAIIAVMNWGLGFSASASPEWRRLAESLDVALLGVRFSTISEDGSAMSAVYNDIRTEALLGLLQRLAQDSGHPELKETPLVFWGHSGGGMMASVLAGQLPQRTLGFVRYHLGGGPGADMNILSRTPALLMAGAKEMNPSNPVETEALWKQGRALGAPWSLAIEPLATHQNTADLVNAQPFTFAWIRGVLRERLPLSGTTLRAVTSDTPAADNWFPDEATATQWRALMAAK